MKDLQKFPVPPAQTEFFLEDTAKLSHHVPVRQVRLAVSMVGGSALCLYENGVAQELFRTVHGHGLYGILKRLTHSGCHIDVLSGTSAGGINTILLSTALVCGTDFRRTREVWIRLGSIDTLMQDPRNRKAKSLLRGDEFYTRELENVFNYLCKEPDGLDRWTWRQKPINRVSGEYQDSATSVPSGRETILSLDGKSESQPGYRDLDLFITGTYYIGRLQTFFDARNEPIFTRNHQGVFQLKHRPRRGESHFLSNLKEPCDEKNDSAQETQNSERIRMVPRRLARVARTTSSLPAIFEPSEVSEEMMRGVLPLPQRIALPGTTQKTNYVLDGGFLNNRPLNLVLKEMYFRATGTEVVRKVLLVEPDPEVAQSINQGDDEAPNALDTVRFYRNVSGYQSLSTYLESVKEHNKRVRRVNETLRTTRDHLNHNEDNNRTVNSDSNLKSIWEALSLQALRDELMSIWQVARGLENFGGLEDGDQTTAVSRQAHLQREANALHLLEPLLLDRMKAFFNTDSDANVNSSTYNLKDVDVMYLQRTIMRALNEIYSTLYPERAAQGCQVQRNRQEVFKRLSQFDTGNFQRFLATQVYIRELFHLSDLTTIVSTCLGNLLGAVARSPFFLKVREEMLYSACSEEASEAVDELWKLLVAALRLMLEDGNRRVIIVPSKDIPKSNDSEERQRANLALRIRHQLEAKGLGESVPIPEKWDHPGKFIQSLQLLEQSEAAREEFYNLPMPTRCKIISQAICFAPAKVEELSLELATTAKTIAEKRSCFSEPEWKEVASCCDALINWSINKPVSRTVATRLNERLNLVVRRAARQLQPLFTELKPGTANPSDVDMPVFVDRDRLPLRWVYNHQIRTSIPYRAAEIPTLQHFFFDNAEVPVVKSAKAIDKRLRELDYYTFPVQRATELESLSPIELIHVTPRGAQSNYSKRSPESKLAGDVLFHFGGFLKASWRANDIMWGRLDGAATLIDTLLDRDRLTRIFGSSDANTADSSNNCHSLVDEAMHAIDYYIARGEAYSKGGRIDDRGFDSIGDMLFPLYQEQRHYIRKWLEEPQQLVTEHDGFECLKLWLLQRHHMEILSAEVPEVVAQGLAEHARWRASRDDLKIGKATALSNSERLMVEGAIACGDDDSNSPVLIRTMRDRVGWIFSPHTNNSTVNVDCPPPPPPSASSIEAYFEREYQVGQENVAENIPALVSLRRVSGLTLTALNVFEPCFKEILDGFSFTQVIWRLLFAPFRLLLTAFYGFTCALESGRKTQIATHSLLWTVLVGCFLLLMLAPVSNPTPLYVCLIFSGFLLTLFDGIINNRRNIGNPLFCIGLGLMLIAAVSPAVAYGLANIELTKEVKTASPEVTFANIFYRTILWWLGSCAIFTSCFLIIASKWRWRDARFIATRTLTGGLFWPLPLFIIWALHLNHSIRVTQFMCRELMGLSAEVTRWIQHTRWLGIGVLVMTISLVVIYWFVQEKHASLRGKLTPHGLDGLRLTGQREFIALYLQNWDAELIKRAQKFTWLSFLSTIFYLALTWIFLGAYLVFYKLDVRFHDPNPLITGDSGDFLQPLLFITAPILVFSALLHWLQNVLLLLSLKRMSSRISTIDDKQLSQVEKSIRVSDDERKIESYQKLCASVGRFKWSLFFTTMLIFWFVVCVEGYQRYVLNPASKTPPATGKPTSNQGANASKPAPGTKPPVSEATTNKLFVTAKSKSAAPLTPHTSDLDLKRLKRSLVEP